MPQKKFTPDLDELLIEQVRKYRALYDFECKDYKDIQIKDNIWAKIATILKTKSAEECKVRWKNIRDTFLKQKKKKKGKTGDAAKSKTKWTLFDNLTFLESAKQERPSMCNIVDSDTDDVQMENSDVDNGEGANDLDSNATTPLDSPEPATESNASTSGTHTPDLMSSRSETPSSSSKQSIKKSIAFRKRQLLENLEERSKRRLQLLENLGKQKEEENDVDLFMRSIAMDVKKLPPHLIRKVKAGILNLVNEVTDSQAPVPHFNPGPNQHGSFHQDTVLVTRPSAGILNLWNEAKVGQKPPPDFNPGSNQPVITRSSEETPYYITL